MTIVIVAGGIDLSVGAIYSLAGVTSAHFALHTNAALAIALGIGVGLLVGVGVEGVRQAINGEFNAGRLVGAAGAGVISGAVAGATMGASLVVQGTATVGAGVVGGVVSRAAAGEPQTTEAVVTDAVVAGVTFGVVKGGGAAIRAIRGTPPPPAGAPASPAAASRPAVTPPAVRPATQLLESAREARDELAGQVGRQKATVTGGYDPMTGRVVAGCSSNPVGCAEDDVVRQLGIDPHEVRFTEATRPRTGAEVPVCRNCQEKFDRSQFPPGTRGQSGGRWDSQ
jgi:hypothetical protein